MIRLNDALRDALAAEYVLGTQSGRVRRHMTRLLEKDEALAARVRWWQSTLDPISGVVNPVPVPPWVWRHIEQQARPAAPERRGGWWGNVMVWRWSTALAGALAVMLALLPQPQPLPTPQPPDGGVVLVLTDDQSRSAWLVSRKSADAPLVAQVMQLPVITTEQAFELWLLPPDASPISVGLLNESGKTELSVPAHINELLQPGLGMAVSIEPPGGSPTGAPTGPVVFTGSVKSL